MKSSKLLTLILGTIMLAVTVISFVLIFDQIFTERIRWITLTVILLSELILIVKMLVINKNVIIQQASIIISILHVILALSISIIFLCFFQDSIKTYIILNILLILILFAVDSCILYFGKKVSADNKRLEQSQSTLDNCFIKAQTLAKNYENTVYGKDLINIAEQIRYSDNTELTGDEATILNKLGDLELELLNDGSSVLNYIFEVKSLIDLRSIKMQSIKKGGY